MPWIQWVRAPMRGLRLETSGVLRRDCVAVTDLRTNERVEVLDLGISEQVNAGTAHDRSPGPHRGPIPAPCSTGARCRWGERTRDAVAQWPQRLAPDAEAVTCSPGQLDLAFSHQSETLLHSDLPQHAWMGLPRYAPPDEALPR